MNAETVTEVLTAAPTEDGEITKYDGKVKIPYRVRRLGPGELNEIRIQRHEYLAERGIQECTPATAEIYAQELELRVAAAAVLDPETGEPLAPLGTWRHSDGPGLRTCIAHYTKLETRDVAIDMATADRLGQLRAHVRTEQGPGQPAFWETVDYETLLACFTKLSREHDQAESDLRELVAEVAELRARVPKKERRKKNAR